MIPRTTIAAHRPGFTLIELMLAIGIMGLVFAMLASSFSAVAHGKIHGEARMEVDREGRAILWQLSSELASAVQTPITPSDVTLIGVAHQGSSGPIDTVSFATLNPGHRHSLTGIGPEDLVTYSLVRNPDAHGMYMLERTQQSALAAASASMGAAAPAAVILADNVLSLHIKYFDSQRWIETWDSPSLPANHQLPVAIAIELQMAAPNGHVMDFDTEISVPMAMLGGMPLPYSQW
ncbi:MAG TPA: type II secretion system protein GspJ [Candidatus Binataceae bacterium]|nr:type II secretion system protein GspJ [Candidatus Binataceae bacterium]